MENKSDFATHIMVFISIFTGHWEVKYCEIIPIFNFPLFHHFEKYRHKMKMWYENAGDVRRDAASQDEWFQIFWSCLLGLVCPRTKPSPALLWEPPNLTMLSQYMYYSHAIILKTTEILQITHSLYIHNGTNVTCYKTTWLLSDK
jgi:hypothetical protein